MGTNVEWCDARTALSREFVTPEDFADEDDMLHDEDAKPEQYGIVFDSGGHVTLVYGSVEDLEALAVSVTSLVAEARQHRESLGLRVLGRMKQLASEWEVYWEYPGIFVVRLDDEREMATGLHGWHYANVSRLVRHPTDPSGNGSIEPTDEVIEITFECTAPEHDKDPEVCQHRADANTLADAIEAAVLDWQEAHHHE
jgi:hypothetical protein